MEGPLAIDRETPVRRGENIVTREQAGEILLVPIRNDTADLGGFLFLLPNEVAVRTWELLAEERTPAELAEILHSEYEESRERIERDLLEFLEQLKSVGALDVAGPSRP